MTTFLSSTRDLLVFVAVAWLGTTFAAPRLAAQEGVGKPAAVDAKAVRATPVGPTIGTVDLVKAFDQYPKWIQLKGELAKMSDQFEDQLKQVTKRLDELRATINATAPDSEERKRAEFELDLGLQQRQWLAKTLRDKARAEEAKAMLAVYEDVEAAIAVVARNRGVALVQRVHELGPAPAELGKLGGKDIENRVMGFERKQVWFAAAEIDLTDDLIKQLMVPVAGANKPAGAAAAGKPAVEPKPTGDAGRGGS
jgi:Skp family chaperone for outer membrane proteins